MVTFKTEQEEFWAGSFGNEYTDRNVGEKGVANNTVLFSSILSKTEQIHSLIEFGANRGINLLAIRNISPHIELSAVEINQQAINELNLIKELKVYPGSLLDFTPDYQRDLVLSKGLLIHINPEAISDVYDLLYKSSRRYICLAEYYNPTPVEVLYRNHQGKLFKRDFAGDLMDKYPDLHLVDYGFVYHRDKNFPQDDLNWFLLEKSNPGSK